MTHSTIKVLPLLVSVNLDGNFTYELHNGTVPNEIVPHSQFVFTNLLHIVLCLN